VRIHERKMRRFAIIRLSPSPKLKDTKIMVEHLVQNWQVRKPLARSRGGIVATQNKIAGAAGVKILDAGGNAVDAAVATGLALAAVEPWNSGLGGVGFMLVYLAKENKVHVVDFGPIAPHKLNPADFPLTGGFTTDLFTWPTVKDDRNVHGPNQSRCRAMSTDSRQHWPGSAANPSPTSLRLPSNWPTSASRSIGT
jgi:hypothetical protein